MQVAFAKSQKVTINIIFENVCQGMKLFPMINRRGGGGWRRGGRGMELGGWIKNVLGGKN